MTQLKKELEWLREVDSTFLQRSLKNLADAFSRYFKKQTDRLSPCSGIKPSGMGEAL
ncbi:hypothetical protein NXZ84_07620 [Mechercharimyces sp. CAU 1602]|nr:hypothetical protein [Mechercharimyces sp. CAU 1602]MCS1351436.1 hypothetical protein [Mechercharimyces sp. CAU 1602]